jgi:hypothetical protein
MTVSADTAVVPTAAEIPATTTPAKPSVTVADLPPEALSKRVEQAKNVARAELLAELGITDTAAAKQALDAHAAAVEAAKTRDQKLAELELHVKAQTEALASSVARITPSITAEQKAAIEALAGKDPAAWLRTYNALSPTWVAPAPTSGADATASANDTAGAPAVAASTSVNTPAPSPAGNVSPPNHAVTYKRLSSTNPFAAAAYSVTYGDACYK